MNYKQPLARSGLPLFSLSCAGFPFVTNIAVLFKPTLPAASTNPGVGKKAVLELKSPGDHSDCHRSRPEYARPAVARANYQSGGARRIGLRRFRTMAGSVRPNRRFDERRIGIGKENFSHKRVSPHLRI